LRLCGEDSGDYFVQTDSSRYFAQQLHANVVYLEHRFYGQSQPFADLSNEHMRFLSLDNVMEDVATFQKATAAHYKFGGKWIVLGGSYSGTIAAIYRLRHPELVVGALAASAPMFTSANFKSSSNDVYDSSISDTSIQNPPDMNRAWAYQSCSTFGFGVMMSANGGPVYQPSVQLCSKDFGLTQRLDYDAYNAAYFQPFITGSAAGASNILFSSGSDDGWSQLSINAQNNHNSAVSVILIQGAGHHYDLNNPTSGDSKNVLAARAQFIALAQKWLGQR